MYAMLEYMYGYFWILIPGMILGGYAQLKIMSTYNKYSRMNNKKGFTGADTARHILNAYNINIPVEMTPGHLTDHYDPMRKVLRLSQNVYSGHDIAALGIAAHEVGHAIQHNEGYAPLKLRNTFYPVSALGSQFGPMLVMVGLIISGVGAFSQTIMNIGIVLFAAAVAFSVITLPVEFNASSRAIKILDKGGFLDGQELIGAKKVLSAAALTYVAAAITAILSLLRLILLANRRRD